MLQQHLAVTVKADQANVSYLLNFDKFLKRHPASQERALQGVMQKFFILLLLLCQSLKSCHSKYICAMFFDLKQFLCLEMFTETGC